jgi:hypothetical protein
LEHALVAASDDPSSDASEAGPPSDASSEPLSVGDPPEELPDEPPLDVAPNGLTIIAPDELAPPPPAVTTMTRGTVASAVTVGAVAIGAGVDDEPHPPTRAGPKGKTTPRTATNARRRFEPFEPCDSPSAITEPSSESAAVP